MKMDTGFSARSKKMAAVLCAALLASVSFMARESLAASGSVNDMREKAVNELRQLKNTPARLKSRASQLAASTANERKKASGERVRELKTLEDELRGVSRTGDLSAMERKVRSNPKASQQNRPPDDKNNAPKRPEGDKRPANDNAKKEPAGRPGPSDDGRGKEVPPPTDDGKNGKK